VVDPMASLPIDDQDAAVYSVGQVAGMLQVTQAFLRRLDELAVVCPARSWRPAPLLTVADRQGGAGP
jgi:hypothetical protein